MAFPSGNAAIVPRTTIHTATVEDFDHAMAVNVRAPLFLIQAAFPQLKANRGSVLNIGSINAHSGEPTFLHYATTKGALQTRTDLGVPGYGGPCPPEGHGPHRYVFTVFAVKQDALPVNADTSAAIVGFQLHFNTIEKATLTGMFSR